MSTYVPGWKVLSGKGIRVLCLVICRMSTAAQSQKLADSSPVVTAAKAELADMRRGRPVRYPCGYVGGRFADAARRLPWIADRYSGPRDLWVGPDDHVRPAEPHS